MLAGTTDLKTVIASADLAVVDKKLRRERFICVFIREICD
jgi:hypothetical protein